jgi:hypothetical protein
LTETMGSKFLSWKTFNIPKGKENEK